MVHASSVTIDIMVVVQIVCSHPIHCIADSPTQEPALHSARIADGVPGPSLLTAVFVRHGCVFTAVDEHGAQNLKNIKYF